ncbi:MAG: hypothetical protein RLZZ558_1001 [Planctomycetota bacterium]|jgi:serine O-acetyltransferase
MHELARSVEAFPAMRRMGDAAVPDPVQVERAWERFRWICFPGYFGLAQAAGGDAHGLVRGAVAGLRAELEPQLLRATAVHTGQPDPELAARWMAQLLEATPAIRALLHADAQEAVVADPAARSLEEVIVCYPGLRVMTAHRLAHVLHRSGVPLVPRMLSELAHERTGIDIHPGASIAGGLFIDHGTGVVIGETAVIGSHCRIYQGVTIGALTPDLGREGRLRTEGKRHPTLGDRVVVYAGATILGGDTVIGDGATIHGGVFLTQSVPPGCTAMAPRPERLLKEPPPAS